MGARLSITCALFCCLVLLSGCALNDALEGDPVPGPAGLANQLCMHHRGVRAMQLEPYDPEFGGGGLEAVICRDGLVREP